MTIDTDRGRAADADAAIWTAELRENRSAWEDPKLAFLTDTEYRSGIVVRAVVAGVATAIDAIIMIPMLDRAFRSSSGMSAVIAGGLAVVATVAMLVAGWEARGAVAGVHRRATGTLAALLITLALGVGGLVVGLRIHTSHAASTAAGQFEGALPTGTPSDTTVHDLAAWLFLALYTLGLTIAFVDGFTARNDAYTSMCRAGRARERLEPEVARLKSTVVQLLRVGDMMAATLRNLPSETAKAKAANAALETHLMARARVVQATILGRPETAGITTAEPLNPSEAAS